MVERNSKENIFFQNYGLYIVERNSKKNIFLKNYGLYGGKGIVKRTFPSKTTGYMVEEE